jgi:hypothetical protein
MKIMSTGGTITFLETFPNFTIAPTLPIFMLPIGATLDPSPGFQIIVIIVPITAFAATGTKTAVTILMVFDGYNKSLIS